MREGLDEESLVIFNLLKKPELSAKDVKRIKQVSVELLRIMKEEKLKIDHWRDKKSIHHRHWSLLLAKEHKHYTVHTRTSDGAQWRTRVGTVMDEDQWL